MHIVVMYAGEYFGSVMTNRSMTDAEAIALCGVEDADLERPDGSDPKYYPEDFRTYAITDEDFARREATGDWENLDA